MTKKKNLQSSTDRKTCTNLAALDSGDYNMIFSFREQPISDAQLRHYATKLIDWVKNQENSYTIEGFLFENNIDRKTWWRWMQKSPLLKQANDFALMGIGHKREMGALERRLDASTVHFTMPFYNETWRDITAWRAKLREGEQAQGSTVHVHMNPIPEVKKEDASKS